MNQQQIDELAAVMSMTSDRVIAAWHALQPIMFETTQEITRRATAFYRSLYAAGIVNTPMSRHPMTARKMRGAIRRLKAGEIGPNCVRPKVMALCERSMRERTDIWQRLAES